MIDVSPRRYLAGTLVASTLVLVGTVMPWMRKLPVATAAESPEGLGAVYTLEGLPGSGYGLVLPLDLFTIVPALLALAVVAVTVTVFGSRNPGADGVLVATGSAIVYVAGNSYLHYYSVERYAVEPGIFLVLAGGVGLVVLGVTGFLGEVARWRDGLATT